MFWAKPFKSIENNNEKQMWVSKGPKKDATHTGTFAAKVLNILSNLRD